MFATTDWCDAQRARNAQNAHGALAAFCQAYWLLLYAPVRRRGRDTENGRDLTEGFCAELLAQNLIQLTEQKRGRFTRFLLAALRA